MPEGQGAYSSLREARALMADVSCRVNLDAATKRRLWADSGGYCGNPSHAEYLFAEDADVDFGELAHIIPAAAKGPRGGGHADVSPTQRAHHTNIVVLCANCHTVVDKAPENYPADLMREWKRQRLENIRNAVGSPRFESRSEARAHIESWLQENKTIYNRYGPSGDPYEQGDPTLWRRHARSTVVPNNRKILRLLEGNRTLLTAGEKSTLAVYSLHVDHFERRHVLDDFTTGTERFPGAMEQILTDETGTSE